MIIQLVSIKKKISRKKKFNEVVEVVNSSTSDLILFGGDTLADIRELKTLEKEITNNHTLVILEEKERSFSSNNLFYFREGKTVDPMTNQKFSESKEIERNELLCRSYLKELKERRTVRLKGSRILILQCGENNIINAHSGADSKAEFRFSEDPDLSDTWDNIFSQTDIVLNPIHTRMKRQALMAKRREYLSSGGRAYFSVNNTDNFNQKSCHYGYVNGKPIEGERSISETGCSCNWIYEI